MELPTVRQAPSGVPQCNSVATPPCDCGIHGSGSVWRLAVIEGSSGWEDVWLVGFGDMRVSDRADWFVDRIVATGSLGLKRLGGTRTGEIAVQRLLASRHAGVAAVIDTVSARTAAANGSRRWLAGAERGDRTRSWAVLGKALSTTVVGDRESDIHPLFANRPAAVDLIVRATHNRLLDDGGALCDAVAAQTPVETCRVLVVPRKPGDQVRVAQVALRSARVTIAWPTRPGSTDAPDSLPMTIVDARQTDPPLGVTPLLWRLLSSADRSPADIAISRSLERQTRRRKNPHHPDSLACRAWITAHRAGWNCHGKPAGPRTTATGCNAIAQQRKGQTLATETKNP